MNKKILLRAFLGTTIIGAAISSFAEIVPIIGEVKTGLELNLIKYTPNEKDPFGVERGIVVEDLTINTQTTGNVGYQNVNSYFTDFIKSGDTIAIDSNSIESLLTDIKANKNGSLDALNKLAATKNITADQLIKYLESVDGVFTTDKSVIVGLFTDVIGLRFIEKPNLTGDELVIFNKASTAATSDTQKKQISDLKQTLSKIETISKNIEEAETKIRQDSQTNKTALGALIKERNKLDSKSTDQTIVNKIKALDGQIYSSPEFIAIRNTPGVQEALKQKIKLVSDAKASGNTDLQAIANTQLESIDKNLYFADPNVVSVSNLPRLQQPDTPVTSSILNTANVTGAVLNDRLSGFNDATGIASGDAFQDYGLWAKAIYSMGGQKASQYDTGYSYHQKGITIGADTGEDFVVGLAYSFVMNTVKNKTNTSARDVIDSHVLSIYGMYSPISEVYISAQGSYTMSKIKKTRGTGDLANNIASASTKGNTKSGRIETGYVYGIKEDFAIVPNVGLAYNDVSVNGYSETGDGLNRKIGKRITKRNSAIAGITVKHSTQAESAQEIHANIDYSFSGKNSATIITINGFDPFTTPSSKLSKIYYNVGASGKFLLSDEVDATVGYDFGMSKKFMSHTGSVKLKVVF